LGALAGAGKGEHGSKRVDGGFHGASPV